LALATVFAQLMVPVTTADRNCPAASRRFLT
jgi:hypothetical protein